MSAPSYRFGTWFLLGLVVGTAAVFFYMVRMFFTPVLLAAVFTTLFHPLYRGLLRAARGRRAVASMVTCLLLVLLLLVPLYAIGDRVTREAVDLFQHADERMAQLVDQFQALTERLRTLPWMAELAPGPIDWQAAIREGAGTVGGVLGTLLRKTSRGTLQVLVTVFVTLFTMFYFFIDGRRIVERIRDLVPLERRHEDAIIARFASVARASVKGTLVIAVVQGTIGGITLAIFGVGSPVLWTVVMIVLSVIPVVGAWLVMYPAALVQLLLGHPWQALAITLVTVVVIVNVDNLLRPRLVGRESGMHDLVIFFSTLGGIFTFGAMGFIVGPVIAAFFLSLLEIYSQELAPDLAGAGGVATPAAAEAAPAPAPAGEAGP